MTTSTQPFYLMSPPRVDWTLQGRANFRSRQAAEADPRQARREWTTLADAIVQAGGDVVVCPPPDDAQLTGMIYTAEAGEFYRTSDDEPAFILPNMAAEHRRDEADWVGRFIRRQLRIPTRRIQSRWEAQGDAIRATDAQHIVHTYGIGPDARTQSGAYAEVADQMSLEHLQIRFDADPWFHGNTFVNIYRSPDTRACLLVICPDAVTPAEYERLCQFAAPTTVHEISADQSLGYDTNALQVGQTVIAPMSLSPGTDRALVQLGLTVERVDLGELFTKGGGAPVCLTNRLWGIRSEEVPSDVRWSTRPAIDAH